MYNDQIRVTDVSGTSDIHHFFVLGTTVVAILKYSNNFCQLHFFHCIQNIANDSCAAAPLYPKPFSPQFPFPIASQTLVTTILFSACLKSIAQLPDLSGDMWYLSFCPLLILLNIISRPIHVLAYKSYFMEKSYLYKLCSSYETR